MCLAKMFDRGLGVEQNKAKMFSWLLWGDEPGNRKEDPDVGEEQDGMRGFYGMTLSDDVKDIAWAIFNDMRATTPRVGEGKSKRRRKALPQRGNTSARPWMKSTSGSRKRRCGATRRCDTIDPLVATLFGLRGDKQWLKTHYLVRQRR